MACNDRRHDPQYANRINGHVYHHESIGGKTMPKIFIDPGHGGKDSGAVGNGLKEKDIVLYVALRMKHILQDEYTNAEVKLSREKDVFVELSERARMANAWGANRSEERRVGKE